MIASQTEMQADADVRNVVLEELSVRGRSLVQLQHQGEESGGVVADACSRELHADSSARGPGPVV